MTELNEAASIEIEVIDGYSFKLKIDTTEFNAYSREGLVENIKIIKKVSYHPLEQSMLDPVASSQYGMLEVPDLRFFGRSDSTHLGLLALWAFQTANKKFPETDEDAAWCLTHAKEIAAKNKEAQKGLQVDEIDEEVIRTLCRFSKVQISPMAAFFGGILA